MGILFCTVELIWKSHLAKHKVFQTSTTIFQEFCGQGIFYFEIQVASCSTGILVQLFKPLKRAKAQPANSASIHRYVLFSATLQRRSTKI